MIAPDWKEVAIILIRKVNAKDDTDNHIYDDILTEAIESELARAYTKGLLDAFTKSERTTF